MIAEAKQREAMRREREAEDNEKMVRRERELNCVIFIFFLRPLKEIEMFIVYVIKCWSMDDRGKVIMLIINLLITFFQRRCAEGERERGEKGGRGLTESGEVQEGNRGEMRDEEARLNDLHDEYMEEAEKAERQARVAEEEAAR